MASIAEINRRRVISKLIKKKKQATEGNQRTSPSRLLPVEKLTGAKPAKPKKQQTMSVSAGRKSALPQRLVPSDKVKPSNPKGMT